MRNKDKVETPEVFMLAAFLVIMAGCLFNSNERNSQTLPDSKTGIEKDTIFNKWRRIF